VEYWVIYGSADGLDYRVTENEPLKTVVAGTTSEPVSCNDGVNFNKENKIGEYLWFKIAGHNGAGTGTPSNGLRWRCALKPLECDPPTKVAGKQSASSITISWIPPDGGLYGAVPTGYKVLYNDGEGGVDFREVLITYTSQTEYTIGGLSAGKGYRIAVKILSETGESEPSLLTDDRSLFVCGADADPPTSVYYISSATTNDQLTVGWDFPGSNGGAPVESWYLQVSNAYTELLERTDVAPPSFTIPNVDPNPRQKVIDCQQIIASNQFFDLRAKYVYFKVAAKTTAGLGHYSPITRIFCAARPDPPVASDFAGSESSITVGWEEGSVHGAELVAYKIYMDDGRGGAISLRGIVEDTSQRYYTATGLTTYREYRVYVTVVSTVAESLASNTLKVWSCGRPAIPSPPVRKTVTPPDQNTITLQWSPPADNGCPMTGYRAYIDQGTINGQLLGEKEIYPNAGGLEADASTEDTTADDLRPEILETIPAFAGLVIPEPLDPPVFRYKVCAYNLRGRTCSEWTDIKAAQEPSRMDPFTQQYEHSTTSSAFITWDDKIDAGMLNGGTLVGFKVVRDDGYGTWSSVPDPTCGMETNPAPQECFITGLAEGRTYRAKIKAVTDVGEGEWSEPIEIVAATFPSPITADMITTVRSETGGGAQSPILEFSWTMPNDGGLMILYYTLFLQEVAEIPGVDLTLQLGDANNPIRLASQLTHRFEDVAGMLASRQYRFRVQAHNANGPSQGLNWVTAWTLNQPFSVVVTRSTDPAVAGAIKISWDPHTADEAAGGEDVSNLIYEVWGAYTGQTATKLTEVNGITGPFEYTKGDVTIGASYDFYVVVRNSAGKRSEFSYARRLISASVPGQVRSLDLESVQANTVNAKWLPPESNGGSPITHYLAYFGTQVQPYDTVPNLILTKTFIDQPGGATVSYYVAAVNSVGVGEPAVRDIKVIGNR